MTLADNAKKMERAMTLSGLQRKELPYWKTRTSAGSYNFRGVLVHHTGAYDGEADSSNDYEYALWMGTQGRSDLPPPLCNFALSAEGVVYPTSAGNANHGGTARASGPMPSGDANSMYLGIEAMNSGSQGWKTKGKDARGKRVTQYQAYVRLCAGICVAWGWDASRVRAHKETSTTGKWDPGLLDMTKFRRDIQKEINKMKNPKPYPVYGETGAKVKTAQKMLNTLDYVTPKLSEDGDFGPKTKNAIYQFESKWKWLKADGIFGNMSWKKLNTEYKKKVAGK